MLCFCKLVLIIALNVLSALCYIPAVPSNDTEKAITAGLNVTDISKLNLHWFSKGYVVSTLCHFHYSYPYLTDLTLKMCLSSWQVTGAPG
jgi:hypothetical protein